MVQNAFQSNKIESIKTYEIPRSLMRLNPNNGRFKAELDIIQEERKERGIPIELDPDNPEDVVTIQGMIRGDHPTSSERKTAYKNLLANIEEVASKTGTNGQEVSGLITHDGILINGNRRWVVMNELAEVTKRKIGEPLKFDKLRVGRLKKGISRYELWKNEAKEQISQESREEYDYVNSALEIRFGFDLLVDQGMNEKKAKNEIAKTLYGRTVKNVTDYLDFLEIADLFLENINKKKQYTYIQESNSDGEGKGIVTLLQDIAKEHKKYTKAEDMDIEKLERWFTAVCAFCKFSKEKPTVTSIDGRKKTLTFGHRAYRTFQKKIISNSSIRDKFLESKILEKINIAKPTEENISEYYQTIRNFEESYDITEDINTPISLLTKAQTSLSEVVKKLEGTHKAAMVQQINNENGMEKIEEIQIFIKEIIRKIKY